MFNLRLLGSVVLSDASGPLTGRAVQKRRLAFLALLAGSSNQGVSRARAAAYFWPDHEPSQGRRRLSDSLYVLRSELGEEVIASSGNRLLLNADLVATDIATLEKAAASGDAERAAEVYGGPFLEGFHLEGTADFMHWVEAERERLARTHKQVLRRAAEASASRDDYHEAVKHWRRLSAHDPYDSQVALGLMRALDAAGNRPLALQHAQEHAAVLQRDLDIDPDSEVTAFAERLQSDAGAESFGEKPSEPAPSSPRAEARSSNTAIPASQPTDGTAPARGQGEEAPAEDQQVASKEQGGWKPWIIGGGAAVLGLLILLVALVPYERLESLIPAGEAPPAPADVVVVLPFKNETGDASLQIISPMTADWITRGLSRTGLVDVIDARLELKGVDTTLTHERSSARDLALRLGAGTLVRGHYYQRQDSLYFQAQIIDVSSGKLLRAGSLVSGSVGAPLESVERLRKNIMVSLSALLNPQLADWAKTTPHLPSYEAYRSFVAAQETWWSDDPAQARKLLRRAVSLDSTFVLAQAYLAKSNGYAGAWAKADSLIRRLASGDRSLSPLMQAELERMTAFCRGEPSRVLAATRRIVELAPRSTYAAWSAADAEMMNGHPRRALDHLRALKTEDAALMSRSRYWSLLAYVHHMLGNYQEELHVTRRARQDFPHDLQIRAEEIRALAALGREDEVQQRLAEAFVVPEPSSEEPTPLELSILAGRELSVHGYAKKAGNVYAEALRTFSFSGKGQATEAGRLLGEQARAAYGQLLYYAGQQEEARRVFSALHAAHPGRVEYEGMLGVIAAALGDASKGQAIDRRLARLSGAYLAGRHLYYRARIAALLGEEDRAVALLRKAKNHGRGRGYPYVFTPHNEPDLLSLRQHT